MADLRLWLTDEGNIKIHEHIYCQLLQGRATGFIYTEARTKSQKPHTRTAPPPCGTSTAKVANKMYFGPGWRDFVGFFWSAPIN